MTEDVVAMTKTKKKGENMKKNDKKWKQKNEKIHAPAFSNLSMKRFAEFITMKLFHMTIGIQCYSN